CTSRLASRDVLVSCSRRQIKCEPVQVVFTAAMLFVSLRRRVRCALREVLLLVPVDPVEHVVQKAVAAAVRRSGIHVLSQGALGVKSPADQLTMSPSVPRLAASQRFQKST